MRDHVAVELRASMLGLEVGLEDLLDVLADAQAAERLEVGQAVEEQDALGERSACFISSIDSWRSYSASFFDAPIVEHAVVQPILVDRGQLVP